MKQIIAATDLSARSDRAIQRALLIGHESAAALEILHVIDDTLDERQIERQAEHARGLIAGAFRTQASDAGNIKTTILRGQDYVEIIKRATETGADLVVLGIHRNKGREMFRGTTAERVVRLGHAPVLVVASPAARAYARVLVGYDFSLHSKRALEFATSWLPHAEFHLVHAIHVPFRGFLGDATKREIARDETEKATARLTEEITSLKSALGDANPRIHTAVREGQPLSVLGEQIANLRPDLVVIGTHGRSGFSHLVLGSVAEELIANATTDVLAVRA